MQQIVVHKTRPAHRPAIAARAITARVVGLRRVVAVLVACAALAQAAAARAATEGASAPVPTANSASKIKLPPGFTANLFAGEPDVVQPIAFTWDARGRMWVVECRSYPKWAQDDSQPGTDSIIILEDTDGDGKFDKKTVFADHLRNASAIEVGFGGVWVGAVPYLMFIPDKDGDDKPDGPPQILLDGWNTKEVKHNIFSSFTWGPDGWLWATNGIQSKSAVGKPGTPADKRVKFDCGVWRYHPTRHVFEVVAVGTTNPWGLDFDEYGQCFITNCVIAHLWHVIPGAHYDRMYGQDFNPYAYGTIHTAADHLHWETGKKWTESREGTTGKTSEAGGGHAHIGAMISQGGNWPAGVYTCNLHGNRINRDLLEPKGSGYVARHGEDFAFWNDPWFRGLAIKQGPDGAVYVSDWSDTGECHNYDKADTSNGRIYRISFGVMSGESRAGYSMLRRGDLANDPERGLGDPNVWVSRTARRLIQERAATGGKTPSARTAEFMLKDGRPASERLKGLWTFAAAGMLSEELQIRCLADFDLYIRSWAVRLAVDHVRPSDKIVAKFAELAKSDLSPVVRLHLASALQRLPVEDRWPIAEALVQHGEDVNDQNLPMMVWFGVEPLVQADPSRALAMAAASKLPVVSQYIARRAVDGQNKAAVAAVVDLLDKSIDEELKKWLLIGFREGLNGATKVPAPDGWAAVYAKLAASKRGEVRDGANELAVTFGDPAALTVLRKQATDTAIDADGRGRAIRLLATAKDPELTTLLEGLRDDPAVRVSVIRGLAAAGKPGSAKLILERFGSYSDAEKAEAVQALVTRPAYAVALLDAVASKQVPKADLTPYVVRQIAGLNDGAAKAKLKDVWGDVKPPEKDKQAKIAQLKQAFGADVLKSADLSNGRAVFTKTCAACHTLFDAGGKVGPNLTGSQRAITEYVLENVVNPSGQVANEYKVTRVETKDDRIIEGIVVADTAASLTLRTTTEDVTIPKAELTKRKQSDLSMMPEGLFDGLTKDEQRDLLGYLASPQQVPSK